MNKLLQVALILFVVSVIKAEQYTFDEDADAQELMPFEGKDLEELSDAEVRFFYEHFRSFWCPVA